MDIEILKNIQTDIRCIEVILFIGLTFIIFILVVIAERVNKK